jgi:hypothetical protein
MELRGGNITNCQRHSNCQRGQFSAVRKFYSSITGIFIGLNPKPVKSYLYDQNPLLLEDCFYKTMLCESAVSKYST